jgi:hypothetical protein
MLKQLPHLRPLPHVPATKEEKAKMIEWAVDNRPLRQRTVRSETTKDKAGTLPIVLYTSQEDAPERVDLFNSGVKENHQDESHEDEILEDESSEYESESDSDAELR